MTKFEEKLEILPIKIIQHPVGNTKYYAAVHVKTLIAQADEEISNLKSQLQQQALPVVPKLTQKQADILNDYKNGSGSLAKYLSVEIKKRDYDYFARAWLDGYTVEKPQLFYLKNKLTTSYLALDTNTGYYEHWGEEIIPKLLNKQGYKISFTQQEIGSMQTGSYEQIEVEK